MDRLGGLQLLETVGTSFAVSTLLILYDLGSMTCWKYSL